MLRFTAPRIDLAISTDDRLTVEMNGRTLFDSRSAAPLSLDDVIEKRITGSFRGYERSFSVEVAPGYNDLAVADCRSCWVLLRCARFPAMESDIRDPR